MHGTDSYLKVTWRKSGELENDQCSNGVVFPAGNLLRPIPRLNPTPGEDIDQLRRQGLSQQLHFARESRPLRLSGCVLVGFWDAL